jgi:DNA polymerase/3'-5' exonuclease PolX
MSKGKRHVLARAENVAKLLVEALEPACECILVVGSVRRMVPTVGDIEIVAMPSEANTLDLFGNRVEVNKTMLDRRIANLNMFDPTGWTAADKQPPKTKKLTHPHVGIDCDLYVVNDNRAWGSWVVVRTGPWKFARYLMQVALEQEKHFADGFLLHGHRKRHVPCPDGPDCELIIPLPTEQSLFEELKIPFISPEARENQYGRSDEEI